MNALLRTIPAICLLTVSSMAMANEDWAYELPDSAKLIYMKKSIQIPCSRIEDLIQSNDNSSIYIAIRDAGLFHDHSCALTVERYRKSLEKMDGVRDAIAFFLYRQGNEHQLDVLAKSFDRDAKRIGDHWTVELFGFLNDWNIAGRRLVRHASYSDGAGSEVLCSALMWKRYLYGEEDFEKNWYRIGKEENIDHNRLRDMFDLCYPSMPVK